MYRELKISKYNYACYNKDGDYLMCNMLRGPESFCKIHKENINKYNKIINEKNINIDSCDDFGNYLYKKGYLIDRNVDELFKIKSMYYNSVMTDSTSLTILPTEQCNLRCKYCYEEFAKGKMSYENQMILLKYIQKRLIISNHLHISWFGGEPLLAIDVIENIMRNVKKICQMKKVIYSSNMTTNAYFLDAKTFDMLYRLRVTAYQITVDGMKEQHDKQRIKADGSGSYDQIMRNLISIKNLPVDKYKFARITIRVNITQEILDRLDEFIKYYKKIFGNDIRFNIRFTITDDLGGKRIDTLSEKLVKRQDVYEKLEKEGVYQDEIINFADAYNAFQPMNLVCYATYKNSYTIGSDLAVYRCTIHFDKKENKLGKISEKGDLDIDNELNNRWYIKKHLENGECKECFYLPCCYNAGCPLKGHLHVFENKCSMAEHKKNLQNYLIYLDKKMDFDTI